MILYPSSAIRYKLIDGLVVILHLSNTSYYILDEVASAMWQACTESACGEATLHHLADDFEIEPVRLKADFESFKRNCIEKGFLVTARDDPDKTQIPTIHVAFPIWHAWVCIIRTAISLRWWGFDVAYSNCARLARSCDQRDSNQTLTRAIRTFLLAENFALSTRAPDDCLLRSLALFRFLRNMGFPVEHCIGVQRFPFRAHAWVEYRGQTLLDADRRAQFTTLAWIKA
jgi:hypothetical protein